MSEYQRYEFMASDRPLTSEQLEAVRKLSSHIEASSGHALIEYNWGDFKHDPLDVLYRYFDGFLYWANWGSHRLALRFPSGALPASVIETIGNTDFGEYVTFIQRPDFDILDIHFYEMEPPDVWTEYELGPLMTLREELMRGDQRSLFIIWLAVTHMFGAGDEEAEEVEDADLLDISGTPLVPPGLSAATPAQRALARLLRLPPEYIHAAAAYSPPARSEPPDDFAALINRLSPDRRDDYLLRLTRDEPGLSRQLIRELRALGPNADDAPQESGPRITFPLIAADSFALKTKLERERQERERQAHLRHLRQIHDQPEPYWRRVTEAVERGSGAGYDEATKDLVELHEVAGQFGEERQFQERFHAWIQPHVKRPALIKRLQEHGFTLPER